MATVPDYMGLSQAQAGLTNQAGRQTTSANRANQSNPFGSLTWGQDANGNWSQSTALAPEWQGVNNRSAFVQNGLLSRLAGGVNAEGLGDWGSTDITQGVSDMPSGDYGATQKVIDATRGLQQPTLQRNTDAERARMAAMGITQGSDASNASEYNLGQTQNDADLKAILAGTQEYGNVFNRQLATRQQGVDENIKRSNLTTALRGSQANERIGLNTSDIASLAAARGSMVDPKFANYYGATPTAAPDIYGAARDSFAGNQANDNAKNAASANRTAGNVGLLGAGVSALGGIKGVGGLLGQGASALGNWFGSGSSGGYNFNDPSFSGPVDWSGGWDTGGSGLDTTGWAPDADSSALLDGWW